MKTDHRLIMNKMEKALNSPGAEHLRFWQVLFNIDVIKFNKNDDVFKQSTIRDDYAISDEALLKRMKHYV